MACGGIKPEELNVCVCLSIFYFISLGRHDVPRARQAPDAQPHRTGHMVGDPMAGN